MQSYVLDIILITLAVVIVLHLIRNTYEGEYNSDNNSQKKIKVRCPIDSIKLDPENNIEIKYNKSEKDNHPDDFLYWDIESEKIYKSIMEDENKDKNNNKVNYGDKDGESDGNYKSPHHKNGYDKRVKEFVPTQLGDLHNGVIPEDEELEMNKITTPDYNKHKNKINIDDAKIKEQIKGIRMARLDECPVDKDTVDVKRYLREYVLNDKYQYHCQDVPDKEKSEFTRQEIDEYRNNQIEFRDKLYGSSKPAFDTVDKMNEIAYQEGIKANGMKISEYYDKLTSNYNNCNNNNCNNNPIMIDLLNGIPNAYSMGRGNNGSHYKVDQYLYEDNKFANGGSINGITGQDPMYQGNMAI